MPVLELQEKKNKKRSLFQVIKKELPDFLWAQRKLSQEKKQPKAHDEDAKCAGQLRSLHWEKKVFKEFSHYP